MMVGRRCSRKSVSRDIAVAWATAKQLSDKAHKTHQDDDAGDCNDESLR
jgi:hypothetical protein